MKKLLLSIGTFAAAAAPVAAVVACGDDEKQLTPNEQALKMARDEYVNAGIMAWGTTSIKLVHFNKADLVAGTSTVLKDGATTTALTAADTKTALKAKFDAIMAKIDIAITLIAGDAKKTQAAEFMSKVEDTYEGSGIADTIAAANALADHLPAHVQLSGMTNLENKDILTTDGINKNLVEAMVLAVKVAKTLTAISHLTV